jgi:hypothetical protein
LDSTDLIDDNYSHYNYPYYDPDYSYNTPSYYQQPTSNTYYTPTAQPDTYVVNYYYYQNPNTSTTPTTNTNTTSNTNLWVNKPGNYRVRAVTSLCKSLWSNVLEIDQEISLNPLIVTSKDTLRTAAGAAAYQWFLDDVLIAGANGPEWIAKKSGQYKVRVSSVNDCNTFSLPLFFEVSNVQMPPSVQLFSLAPNPANDHVQMQLELARPERINISLTDAQGRQIFQQSHTLQQIQLPINLSALPSGTYYLHVDLESGRFTRPLVRL